jgi:hypothetical protein
MAIIILYMRVRKA